MARRKATPAASSGPPTRPVEAVAVATRFVDRMRLFHCRSEIRLNQDMASAWGSAYGPPPLTTPVRHHRLEDVVLDADTRVLLKDGIAIKESTYFVPADKFPRPAIDKTRLVMLDPTEDLVLGYNNAHWDRRHWLTQSLPAIDWSLRQRHDRAIRLLLPPLAVWQEDFLEILGYSRVPRLMPEAGHQYSLPNVEYSEFLNGQSAFGVSPATIATAHRVLARVALTDSPHRVLYVPNEAPHYGFIRNAAALEALIERSGIYIVGKERLTTAQRINLFRHADVVFGPFGPGLGDILFCRSGTLLWEWTPAHHQNASINRLALAAGIDYWGDVFPGLDDPDRPGQWLVDLDTVNYRLGEIDTRMAGRVTAVRPDREKTRVAYGMPLDRLLTKFASLGAEGDFSAVQRAVGAEPANAPWLAGINEPDDPIGAMVKALTRASKAGDLPEDVRAGMKIWVWQDATTMTRDEIQPLTAVLRRYGPNTLLWVTEADESGRAGTVERLEPALLKGFVQPAASPDSASDDTMLSWFRVCQAAYDLCHPDNQQNGDEETPAMPLRERTLSALEILARNPAPVTSGSAAVLPASPANWLASWIGRRRR